METPDGFENNTIFLAPHEKKEFTYYIDSFAYNEASKKNDLADAQFKIIDPKNPESIPNLSLAEGTVTVDSIELKSCPFTDKKLLLQMKPILIFPIPLNNLAPRLQELLPIQPKINGHLQPFIIILKLMAVIFLTQSKVVKL